MTRPSTKPNAYLFDIDGTLMDTKGRGSHAFLDAMELVFDAPAHDAKLIFSGATDLGLIRQMKQRYDIDDSPDQLARFFQTYATALEDALPENSCDALPGAGELLTHLREQDTPLGLVTGNAASTAAIKVRACGLADFFTFGGYGDEDAERSTLVRLAIERAPNSQEGRGGKRHWALVGDTPNDIAAARANHIFSIGVTTGSHNSESLRSAESNKIISYLSDLLRF